MASRGEKKTQKEKEGSIWRRKIFGRWTRKEWRMKKDIYGTYMEIENIWLVEEKKKGE